MSALAEIAPFLPGIALAYGILLVGAASPGPAVAMLLGVAMGQGRRAAVTTCLGIACGSATINLATLAGVGLLLSQVAWAGVLLKIAGAAYLAWLAVAALNKAVSPPVVAVAKMAPRRAAGHFALGYLMQVTNPKAIAFWLAIAATAATEGAAIWIVAVFVIGAAAISFSVHAAWALVFSAGPVRAAYARLRRWIEAALGVFFASAAAMLVTARV